MMILGITTGILLLIRHENIPYFSMRPLLGITVLLMLFFIYRTVKKFIINYPKEKFNIENNKKPSLETHNPYLPNKKRK